MKLTKPISDILLSASPELALQRLRSRAPDTVLQIRSGCYGSYNADGSFLVYWEDAMNRHVRIPGSIQRCEFHGELHPWENGCRITGAFVYWQISRWLWVIVFAALAYVWYNVLRSGENWTGLLVASVLVLAFVGFQTVLSQALTEDKTAERKILSLLRNLEFPDEAEIETKNPPV